MNNIRLTIAYDGGRFLGWQKTSKGPSIQESLETVLQQVLQEKIGITAPAHALTLYQIRY